MTAVPFPSPGTTDEPHQPNPPDGPTYKNVGANKWILLVNGNTADLSTYYTKDQVDTLIGVIEGDVTDNAAAAAAAAVTANAAIPATQKAAANGVASLGSDGKVPSGQLPAESAAVWADITGKPSTFPAATHAHGDLYYTETEANALLAAKLNSANYTAADVLTKIKTVDGPSSLLDADLLDGQHATAFAAVGHNHSGVYSGTAHNHDGTYVKDVRLGAPREGNLNMRLAGEVVTAYVTLEEAYVFRTVQKNVTGTWVTVSDAA